MRNLLSLTVLPVIFALTACGPVRGPGISYSPVAEGTRFEAGTAEADRILWASNTASFEVLDEDVGLDRRAAENIVDERPFTTLAALDEVPWVGAVALEKLHAWALEHGEDEPPATLDDDALILWAANTLSLQVLDDEVGLDSRAAQNIVDERPFTTVEELDAVAWVGGSALQKLLDYAQVHHPQDHGDHPLADVLFLRAVNGLTLNQLDDDLGIERKVANRLMVRGPFYDADEVRGVLGVRDQDLLALRSFALDTWGGNGTEDRAGYGWCDDDGQEPNESPLRARPLREAYDYVVQSEDSDWHTLEVEAGATVALFLATDHAGVDAVLYDAEERVLAVANDPLYRDEYLVWTNPGAATTLYLEVTMHTFYGCAGYTVDIATDLPTEDCGDEQDNDGDGDWDCSDSDCSAAPACLAACPDSTGENHRREDAVELPVNTWTETELAHDAEEWFRLEVPAGQQVRFAVNSSTGLRYTVYEGDEVVLYDSFLSTSDVLANPTGTPRVLHIRVENVHGCRELRMRPNVEALPSCATETEVHPIQATQGESLWIEAELERTYGTLEVHVVDPNGDVRAYADTASDESIEIGLEADVGGTWTVEVTPGADALCAPYGFAAETRTALTLTEDLHEPNDDEERAAVLFDLVDGVVKGGDQDFFQITVPGRTHLHVDIDGSSNVRARLWDPYTLNETGDLGGGGIRVSDYNSSGSPRTWWVQIDTLDDQDAAYHLELTLDPA